MKIEEQAGETRSLRRTPTLRLKMEEESPQPRNVGSLYKAGNSTQLRASKETGPQSYNHKELNSANNLNELGKGLQASDKVATLASTW